MSEFNLLEIYAKELKSIPALTDEENEELLARLCSGEYYLKDLLVEGNLHFVVECVLQYEKYGSAVDDLIQEGNLALLSAVDEAAATGASLTGAGFRSMVEERVAEAVEAALREEEINDAAAIRMAREANDLFELTKEFEAREGRAATMDELVKETGLSAGDIEYIIRVSQSAIELGSGAEQDAGEKSRGTSDPLKEGWE